MLKSINPTLDPNTINSLISDPDSLQQLINVLNPSNDVGLENASNPTDVGLVNSSLSTGVGDISKGLSVTSPMTSVSSTLLAMQGVTSSDLSLPLNQKSYDVTCDITPQVEPLYRKRMIGLDTSHINSNTAGLESQLLHGNTTNLILPEDARKSLLDGESIHIDSLVGNTALSTETQNLGIPKLIVKVNPYVFFKAFIDKT